jgi:hypothetical protein
MRSGEVAVGTMLMICNIDDGPGEQPRPMSKGSVLMTPLKRSLIWRTHLHGGNGPSLGGGVEGHASALRSARLPPRLTSVAAQHGDLDASGAALRICLTMTLSRSGADLDLVGATNSSAWAA